MESTMADAQPFALSPPGGLKLAQALLARSSLWAVCGCGREAVIDPAPWVAQGMRRQPLAQLEPRLRCQCGARRVSLEIRGLAEAPGGPTGGIHIFR
jgi:hypothetical protein